MGIFQTLRQFRIGEFAVIDAVLSFVIVYLIAPYLSRGCKKLGLDVPKASWLYLTIPIGVLAHWLFRVVTPLTSDALDPNGHLIPKLVILILLILGLKDIRLTKKK